MNNYVPNYEDRYYEVHPSQLRWAMHQLGAIPGYNVQGYAQGRGGMYIIVVQVPVGAPQADWHDAPPRRRSWRIDGRQVLAWLCVLVIVGGLGYLGYTMATGGALPTWDGIAASMPALPEPIAQMFEPPLPRGEPVVEKSGWHWPWESSVISKPAPKQEGFRWPWQDAQDAVGAGVQTLTNAVLAIGALVLLGGLLWLVGIVRGAIGK